MVFDWTALARDGSDHGLFIGDRRTILPTDLPIRGCQSCGLDVVLKSSYATDSSVRHDGVVVCVQCYEAMPPEVRPTVTDEDREPPPGDGSWYDDDVLRASGGWFQGTGFP